MTVFLFRRLLQAVFVLLLAAHRRHGGELIRVMVETAEPIGRFVGFKPTRAVTAWAAIHD